ncbi:unnamed protein product [Rotaria sp. Silwood2]|nr:unnamed protein product [Rotaria sp. Silwood2]CAF2571992.1 unnamed protein product [Rotaria sp. Silwood2]CAF2816271.1 unnamed protein product [Rotaria sp. Silwood2]CAF2965145.1 unnamed protein product [Rotaria sp. Silwood2]CAF3867629.1 unnamed protein product [Rotaria sp. Silwood2]
MSLDADIDQELCSSASPSRRHFLIVPSFNPERRHSWGNVKSITSVTNSPPPPVISITRSSSSSDVLTHTIRPFLAKRKKKVLSSPFSQSPTSFSSTTIRSFPFRCCGARKRSSQIPSVEQTSTTVYTRRKSSTPSISSRPLSTSLIQNHQNTYTKTATTSTTAITISTKPTKKRCRRGGMASTCTSCVSSNNSRRQSSVTDDVTTVPIHSSPDPSSRTPPLLVRLGRIILRRRTPINVNHSKHATANNKAR